MINLIIKDGNKVDIITENNKKEKKHRIALVLTAVSIYMLTKITAKHELEITNLKKVIEEMKSKGE